MRYADYLREATRLEKAIAGCWDVESRMAEGRGLMAKLFPGMRRSRIETAMRKRAELAHERHRLWSAYFGDPAVIANANMALALGRTVPVTRDAVERLRDAAEAALKAQSEQDR